jgi:hypothetical protein
LAGDPAALAGVERLPADAAELNPVEGLCSSPKAGEPANLGGPTLAEVIDQAHRGIDRVRHHPAPGLLVPAAHRPVGGVMASAASELTSLVACPSVDRC